MNMNFQVIVELGPASIAVIIKDLLAVIVDSEIKIHVYRKW